MKDNAKKNDLTETYSDLIDLIEDYLDSLPSDQTNEGSLESELIQNSKYGEQYDNRDMLYTELLDHYINTTRSKNESNKKYKKVFFWVVVCVFIALVATPIIATVVVLCGDIDNVSAVVALIGSAISAIPAVIVLPKIIAQHLFPTDEDKNMIDLVKSMQENDSGIRSNIKKED